METPWKPPLLPDANRLEGHGVLYVGVFSRLASLKFHRPRTFGRRLKKPYYNIVQ